MLIEGYQTVFARFWTHHPALLYGLAAFLGSCLALYDLHYLFILTLVVFLIIPSFLFIKDYGLTLRLVFALTLGCSAFFLTRVQYVVPSDQKTDNGTAYFKLTGLSHTKTPFGAIWSYKGVLHSFIADGKEIAKNIPISLSMPAKTQAERPPANFSYRAEGHLKNNGPGRYALALSKKEPWVPFEKTWNLGEWRFRSKTYTRQHIYNVIKDPHAAAFLAGIATGEFDDRILSFELGRFGLQHLMAISGLHFAILASILGLMLQLFFPSKFSALLLIVMLSAYFIFLGWSPSVIRAWIAITIALCGVLIGKRGIALNSLGVALLVMAICDPLAAGNIGFQFSFAVTVAILMWFSPCDALCQRLFAKRRLTQLVEMSSLDQHGYCILFFLRQAIALGLAVNLVALPMTLYHFHKFPMMSLVYNVFFPLLMSVCMLLLLAGIFTSFILPFASNLLHSLNESFTQFLLSFAFNLPKSFDIAIRVDDIPQTGILIYLVLVFVGGIFANHALDKENDALFSSQFL